MCQYCGSKEDLTFDHFVPRSKGGLTTWNNVITACSSCNLKNLTNYIKISKCTQFNYLSNQMFMNCTGMVKVFHLIIFMKVGWISYIGIQN